MSAPAATDRSRCRGLTLIELMIGLAITAMLMSLAVPSLGTLLQRQRLKAAAQAFEVDLREARFEAVRRSTALHLTFSTGTDWCYAVATTPECDCRLAQPCRIKAARAADFSGVALTQAQGMRFDPGTGQAVGGGALAVWQSPAGDRVRASVSAMGRPYLCMLDGQIGSLPAC